MAKRALGRVVIDHHPTREEFGDATVRVTSAAATAVLVEELLDATGWPCTPQIATCLLTGLMTDTGRFQYQNANPSAFACASRLVDAGAEPARIALEVYQSQRLEYLRLESIVMSRIETRSGGRVAFSYAYASDLDECGVKPAECDGLVDIVYLRLESIVMSRIETRSGGRVAFSYAYASDLDECGVKPAECDGLVDIVRQVGGTELCLFLRESEPGVIRGNLRSKGKLDISGIAVELGGGGHAAAAGFTFHGTIAQAAAAALPKLEALL